MKSTSLKEDLMARKKSFMKAQLLNNYFGSGSEFFVI